MHGLTVFPEPLIQAVLFQATTTKETSNNDLSDTENRAAENVLLSYPMEPESKTN